MENLIISNKKFYDLILDFETKFAEKRKSLVDECESIIGNSFTYDDIFFVSAVNRSIALLDGFLGSLKSRNITVVGIILRVQIDNILRIFAAYISEDQEEFFKNFLDDGKISKLKDKDGHKMTDAYLKEKISKYDSTIETVYNNASGYVHLSNKARLTTIKASKNKEYEIVFNVGNALPEEYNKYLIEAAEAFLYYIDFQMKFLRPVSESKKRLDEKIINENK